MNKAHVLVEHPTDPTIRAEAFIIGRLLMEFIGDVYLPDIKHYEETGETRPALFRGQPIREGDFVVGRPADPTKTLAEYTVDSMVDEAAEYGIQPTVTRF